jgi:hypothetical protein
MLFSNWTTGQSIQRGTEFEVLLQDLNTDLADSVYSTPTRDLINSTDATIVTTSITLYSHAINVWLYHKNELTYPLHLKQE